LDRFLIYDEKWIMYSNIKHSYQSVKPNIHQQKILLCIWTIIGIENYELHNYG